MTDNNRPITPPPKLLQQWWDDTHGASYEFEAVATQAARWGADQELEACSQWIHGWYGNGSREVVGNLYAARRPKPPSLKAGAIEVLDELDGLFELPAGHYNTILRALEQLDDSL